MLRVLVLALLLLNAVYFAWSQGLLRAYGFGPVQQTEPQRLAQQIRPEALRVLSAQEQASLAESAPGAAQKSAECLQAGVFDETQVARLRSALESADLPRGSWRLDAAVAPAHWIVYMGKFTSLELLAKKRSELSALNLKLEPLTNPALQPGLSLGGFDTKAAADALLETLNKRGVRTAQVVQEHTEVRGSQLRIPEADEALRSKLEALKPALADKALIPCR